MSRTNVVSTHIRRVALVSIMALALGLAAVPVVHALDGSTGRFQDVGLLTAQPARTDGYNHFLVTVGGPGAPRPQGQNLDPILWQPGWSQSAYLTNLDALEAQGLTVSVYTQSNGVVRARLVNESQAQREAQVALVRSAMNTPAPPQLVKTLAATSGVHQVTWLTPGLVSVQTHRSATWVSHLPGVTSVSADPAIAVQSSTVTPTNPTFPQQWDLSNTGQTVPGITGAGTPGDDVNVLSAWSATQGQGVTVAVLDMGVIASPWGLAQVNSTSITNAPNYNFVNTTPGAVANTTQCSSSELLSSQCESLHGTWVSGVIDSASNGNGYLAGIAPGANMLEEAVGVNGSIYIGDAISAVYYALDHGARILNMSWGGTGDYAGLSTLQAAIQQANTDGALVIAAAGNNNQNVDPTSSNPSTNSNPDTFYPAALSEPNIISVGASTPTNTKASFSNYGAQSVSLFAPGDSILTPTYNQELAYVSGTSMAAPVVAGAAADVWSVNPTLTAAQVKADLMNTVTPSAALQGDAEAAGVVNIGAAVAAAEQGAMTTTFSGFNTLVAATPGTTTVRVADPASASSSGSLDLRLSLAINASGTIAAAGGIPVTYTEGGSSGTATTDAAGVLTIPAPTGLATGATLQLGLKLPWSGQWGMSVAVVPANDPTTTNTLGARAVYFAVSGSATAPTPTAPPAPSSGTSTGTGGSTSTSAPSTGTSTPSIGTSTGTGGSTSTTTPSTGISAPSTGTSTGTGGSTGTSTPSTGTSTPSSGTSSGGSTSTTTPSLKVSPSSQEIPPSSPSTSPTPVSNPVPTGSTGGGGSTGSSTPSSGTSTPSSGTTSNTKPSGTFGLESVQPNVVSTSGGTQVTIYGTAIPSGAGVLIGGQSARMASDNAPASLSVIAPPAVAGTYNVEVISPSGVSQTMDNVITYQGTSTPSPSTGGSTGTSTPSSGTSSGTGGSTGTSTPSSSTGGSTGTSTPSSGTSSGTGGSTGTSTPSSGTSSGTGGSTGTSTPSSGTSSGTGGSTGTSTTPPPDTSTPSSSTVVAPSSYNSTPSSPTVYTLPSANQADSDLSGAYGGMWSLFSLAGSSSSGYAV